MKKENYIEYVKRMREQGKKPLDLSEYWKKRAAAEKQKKQSK